MRWRCWAPASAAVNELRRAVNEAWRTKEPRPFVQAKALDLGVTIVVAPLAVAALALKLANVAPATLGDRPALTGALDVLLTDLLPAAIVFGLLLGLYRILPASGATLRAAWPALLPVPLRSS